MTHDCYEMTGETPIKRIPTRDADLHLGNHKVENDQNLVDEQELKVKHAAGKNMPLFSMIGAMICIVKCDSFGTRPKKMRISQRLFIRF